MVGEKAAEPVRQRGGGGGGGDGVEETESCSDVGG